MTGETPLQPDLGLPLEDEDQGPDETAFRPENLPWYFGGQGAWFAASGLQMVLFPYLSAFVLGLDARFIGIAQLALMGPGLILLMPGGVIADHVNERSYLIRLHLLATLPGLIIATVILSEHVNFWFLILYAVLAGSLSTLAVPARDSLLNHMVPHSKLNQYIALSIALQFGGQLVGMVIAGFAQKIGAAPFFILHSLCMLGGALSLRMLDLSNQEPTTLDVGRDFRSYAKGIGDAFRYIFHSRILAPVMIINSAIGFLFVGSFMVCVPIFVRDVFQGSALSISILHTSFFVGTVVSALSIMRIGTVHRRGRLMVLGLIMGTTICYVLMIEAIFATFIIFMFCWGLGAGVVMTMSRTIIQEAAPPEMRARLLASFQVGIMGFGPLGSLTMGFVINAVGVQQAMLVPALGMTLVLGAILASTRFWHLSSEDTAK